MPDPAVLDAPPAPPSPPSSPGGTDDLVSQLESVLTPEPQEPKPADKPKSPAKQEPKVEPKAEPKPEPKAEPKSQPKKVEPKDPDANDRDPVSLRKRLQEIKEEYSGFKLTSRQEQEKFQKQIQAYESREYLTPEQKQKYEDAQSRVKDLESKVYAFNYQESPEYKEKYITAWQKRSQAAERDVAAMQVITGKDEETGKETVRQATAADWMRVLNAPTNPEAGRIARELFGADAFTILQHRNALQEIQEQAQNEVDTRRKTYDTTRSQEQEQLSNIEKTHKQASTHFDQVMVEKFPQLFTADSGKPAETEALQKGQEFVRELMEAKAPDVKSMSAQDMQAYVQTHAQKSAIMRRWASSFPLMVRRIEDLRAELAAKDEELAKYRKTDPGAGGDDPTPTPKNDGPKGTDELAAVFDKLK